MKPRKEKQAKPKKGKKAAVEIAIAEVRLPIFKQGDDLREILELPDIDNPGAITAYAGKLEEVAKDLRGLATLMASQKDAEEVNIQADGHMIQLVGPKPAIDELVEKTTYAVYPEECC